MPRLSRLYVLAAFFCIASIAQGQDDPGNPGTPSWSAYDPHQYDTINLQNLNVVLNVPVMSKSGAFRFSASLTGGDSYVYYSSGSLQPGILAVPLTPSISGVLSPFGYAQVLPATTTTVTCPSGDGSGTAYKYSGWYVQFPDGTAHKLPPPDAVYGGASCSSTLTNQVIDGTGWTVTINGGTYYNNGGSYGVPIVSSGGMLVSSVLNSTYMQDAQSTPNKISYAISQQTYTDTLGVEALTVNANAAGQLEWFDENGGYPTETQTFINPTLKSSFGCSGKSDYTITNSFQTPTSLTTAVSFPDSTNLALTWEPNEVISTDYTGRLASMTLRDGVSKVSFNYNPSGAGAPYNFNCTYLVPNSMTRTTSDGTTTYTWALVNNGSGHYGNTTTVVDNGGNKTVYTFTGLTATGNAASPVIQALTQVQHYQGSSLLTTDVYCYNGATTGCVTAVVSLPVTEVDVYHTINGMSNSSRQQTQYDGGPSGSLPHYGNRTYSAQYDFGATTPTQTATIVYGSSNGSGTCSAIGNNVNNKPCTIITTVSGATVGYSQFTYDSHGNLLKTYVSPNGGTSFLSNATNNSYNADGTPSVTYDVANHPTTYAYNSSSYNCGIFTCTNFPFATSVTKGGLTTYSTWHGLGGVKLTDKDASGNTTTYGYQNSSGTADPFWRVSSVTDPLGNETWKSYTATSLNSSLTFGSSINNTTLTTDGYGRPINTQTQQSPSASQYDTASTEYGWSSTYRSVTTTLPCSTTSGSQCSFTSGETVSLVDPLGRPYTKTDGGGGIVTVTYPQNDVLSVLSPAPSGEHTKSVQNEFDGLGRLKSVCGIMSSGGYSSCNQNTGSYSGKFTTYAYTAATGSTTVSRIRGAQTRSKTVDGLGRVTSITNPESGTTTYVYDSDSACNFSGLRPSSTGDLISKVDANGNKTCYSYDSLHRVTDVGVLKNGACYSPVKRFRYDNTSNAVLPLPSGYSASNTSGHMVEAWTGNCVWPTPQNGYDSATDEWFAYSPRGEMTDLWESTAHILGYYHGTASYAANGALSSVGGVPGYTSISYGLDGEGRLSTATQGTTDLATGVTYTAASQPKDISLGAGDSDDYVYDPSTGRMTKYTFTVNGVTDVGVLTWNKNATLATLAITDNFNSGGTQTCNSSYDDISRLVSYNCGSVGSQTFSYDQYDNLTTAANGIGVSWNPGYDPTTNHASAPITYDSNGNLTNDTFFTYGWYVDNKLGSTDSTTCTIFGSTDGTCVLYDAFGQEVERGVNGAYTEVMYTPVGKTAIMNGQTTTVSAYFPLPGGATYFQTGTANGSGHFWHKDWLGSARISSSVLNRTVYFDRAFAPYGEMYKNFGNTAGLSFTGDTQDSFNGLFDTPNRELHPGEGRWLSPDPAGAGWNLYAYTTNPNSRIDPSGLDDAIECADNGCDGGGGGGGGGGGAGGGGGGGCDTCSPPPVPTPPCPGGQCTVQSGPSTGSDQPLDPLNLPSNAFGPPPSLGPQPTDSGTPSGIQIVGLAFQYQGLNGYTDANGNAGVLFSGIPGDATVFANVWMLQVANENGQAMSGNFSVTETVNTVSGNISPYLVNFTYTWNSTNFNGQFVDDIVLQPNNLNNSLSMQNTQRFTINGTPASTVINQFALYQPGMGLVIGNPWYANSP